MTTDSNLWLQFDDLPDGGFEVLNVADCGQSETGKLPLRAVAQHADGAVVLCAQNDRPAQKSRLTLIEPSEKGFDSRPLGSERVTAGTLGPTGRFALARHEDRINVWDVQSAAPAFPSLIHGDTVVDMDCAPDGRRILSLDASGLIRIWDLASSVANCEFTAAAGYKANAQYNG